MRYLSIERLEAGMVLAKTVYDNSEMALLESGNQLTDEFIKRLEERGLEGLYIEDELSRDIYIDETISMELRNKGVTSLKENDMEGVLEVAKNIVEQLLDKQEITLDLIDLRSADEYTYRHSVNVAVLSTVIGMGFGFSQNALIDLCVASLFHDLGKLQIDPKILNKPARLNEEEFIIMKEHVIFSYNYIKDRKSVSEATKKGVLHHHENEDGSGYPKGLERDEIPPFAKIIHIADVYDALISKRPYKKPYALSEAIEYLMGGCDILFDKGIVEAFLTYVPVYPKGVGVRLSDGREGVVVENNKNTLRPKVRLLTGEEIDLGDPLLYRNITIGTLTGTDTETDFSSEIARREDAIMLNKKHILIVDDMITNLKTAKGILENDYKVSVVKSGEQALSFLRKNKLPDLILMDIDMPEMDGIETVKRIQKEFDENVNIIFLTALTDPDIVAKCREVNAKDYIVKPFKPIYVQERIKKILKGYDDE